jgi:hypothetical protein
MKYIFHFSFTSGSRTVHELLCILTLTNYLLGDRNGLNCTTNTLIIFYMNKMHKLTKLSILGATAALSAAVFIFPVSAATPADTIAARVAQILGVSQEQLTAAFRTATIEEVQQKVTAGDITEEQGSNVIDRIQSSTAAFPGLRVGGRGLMGRGMMAENLTEFLGITTDELNSARQEGKSVADLLAAAGKTFAELREYNHNQQVAQVKARVSAGEITEEEGNNMISIMEERYQDMQQKIADGQLPEDAGVGGPRGGRGMGMGMGANGIADDGNLWQ